MQEIEWLPAPVQCYFRAVLKNGQSIISAATIEHFGTFNISETGEQWNPFTSTQTVVTRRPGFVWDARIMMYPALPVHVHDAYVAGVAVLHGAIFGLLPVINMPDSLDLQRGELLRYFMEALWYPTALLPGQGVHWEAVDDKSARATLTDGAITLSLTFHFLDDGLIDTVVAATALTQLRIK